MVTIYVRALTPRLTYTMDFIFRARGVDYRMVQYSGEAVSAEGIVCSYGPEIEGVTSFACSGLLEETDIRSHEIGYVEAEDVSPISFDGTADLFASVFYVLSRYEEYLCTEKDEHGRFPYGKSLLAANGWITHCVCDRWALRILEQLGCQPEAAEVKIVPTFDIDNSYAYRYKTGKRRFLSVLRDLFKADAKRLKERSRVKKGARDPYDTFERIAGIAKAIPSTRIFWLVADLGPKDRNLSVDLPEHKALIGRMDVNGQVGLHPGYGAGDDSIRLANEKKRLEQLLEREVIHSRQHFLKFHLPETFALLEKAGFRHEYSMGFAEHPGFRSGTARSHLWFDLMNNRISELEVHPFVYMDGTLNEYLHLTIEGSKEFISELYKEVKACGGDFMFIWHNETIGDYGKWKDWGGVLEYTLKLDQ